MTNKSKKKDIVIDTNIIKLYESPDDPQIRALFLWVRDKGRLAISPKLLAEYVGIGNRNLAGLIGKLAKEGRLVHINTKALKGFNADKNYNYVCNKKDIWHARLVFLSIRKLLVAGDNKLIQAVNDFPKVNGIKPQATKRPTSVFYE